MNWLPITEGHLSELFKLGPGWDGSGGRAITTGAILAAARLVKVLAEQPAVVPLASGNVQLEWHSHGLDIEAEIDPGGNVTWYTGRAKP